MNIPVLPIAVGAGVALVLGVLLFSGKAKAAPPKPATKTPPKKTSGGGSSVSKTTDWKVVGYKAGLAQGKADKAKGSAFFLIPSRVVSGVKMPGTPGSTTSDAKAVASWTTGYADGYPVGYGKIGSTVPRYATDAAAEEEDASGTIGYTDGPTGDSGASDEGDSGESDVETSGVPVDRPAGSWGPRQTVLARVKSRRAAA